GSRRRGGDDGGPDDAATGMGAGSRADRLQGTRRRVAQRGPAPGPSCARGTRARRVQPSARSQAPCCIASEGGRRACLSLRPTVDRLAPPYLSHVTSDTRTTYECFAVTAPGLEPLAARELRAIGARRVTPEAGG